MTTMERLIKVFCAVFEDEFDPETMTESATLLGDLGMNSISLLYMAMATSAQAKKERITTAGPASSMLRLRLLYRNSADSGLRYSLYCVILMRFAGTMKNSTAK